MKKINTDTKYITLIVITLMLAIILTYAHHGNIIIDCGREVYYPAQILLGKVLYKDIFNIYGPFSYMFNSVLFKLFGINLNVLYIAGCACSFLITVLIYLISKRFLSKFLSFAISIFTISVGVLNLNLFNFIFPYSYAMLYGIVGFLASLMCLLKYQENPEKTLYLYLSSFFAGLCITGKYEFLPYLGALLYAVVKIKSLNFKQCYFVIFSLLFMPTFCFGILFLQGLRLNDLIFTVISIKKMAQSQTLNYFYKTQGVYFNNHTIIFLLTNFFMTIIPFSILIFGFKSKKKVLAVSSIILSTIMMCYWISPSSFVFVPILITVLALWNFKNLIKNIPLFILTLASIAISLKVFWGLITVNYGVFFISILFVTLLGLLSQKSTFVNTHQTTIGVYILIVATIYGYQNIFKITPKNYFLSTSRGGIYSNKIYQESTKELIEYLESNTKKSDTVLIFPESPFINFLTDRKSDDIYNSLIPLYVETFGENNIIKHFEKTKPEYIIFNNWETKDYYYKYICRDYALSFCNYVAQNYTQEKIIDKGFRYLIFKKK